MAASNEDLKRVAELVRDMAKVVMRVANGAHDEDDIALNLTMEEVTRDAERLAEELHWKINDEVTDDS